MKRKITLTCQELLASPRTSQVEPSEWGVREAGKVLEPLKTK
jgi:hypothetical protein